MVMKRCLVVGWLLIATAANAQDIKQKLEDQVKALVADSQMRAGILGLYVANAQTGEEIFSWNGKTGLAPASTQKIITSVAAFELLGNDYRYKTEFWGGDSTLYKEPKKKKKALNDLFVIGAGDPTLGSWRYASTKEDVIADSLAAAMQRMKYDRLKGCVFSLQNKFDLVNTPGGWIYDDMGNYYGAGTAAVNWKENQFDLTLLPGKNEGDPVEIDTAEMRGRIGVHFNLLTTGKTGSGDNAYIYYDKQGRVIVAGTAASATGKLTISGAAEPHVYLGIRLAYLLKKKISIPFVLAGEMLYDSSVRRSAEMNECAPQPKELLYTHYSPALDSIIYWFMKRSINLYGEALLKTIAFEKTGVGSTDSGVVYVRRFYKEKGFDIAGLRIIDGSGLSPQNRVAPESLCKVLSYARQQSWFPAFAQSFPRFNDMNLKSGTIGGAKSYAGYHTAADGKEYVVSIVVNNYDGTARSIESKMFKVLDVLK
jgi:serine-type D-Ala-D-Ala carboxypeptidase/endopeptidase (penicillin-binding protein 4)